MSKLFDMANEPERGMLVYIPTSHIDPHPDNPRKELGDLTELAASIAENGILQNLTVVPAEDGRFTALIGHRRLAAAAQAGLTEVPCVIVEMDYREQLQTMLQENMQRSDLTTYEQAKGFQMMLDLGDTVENLAKTSGFSESTIRRRVKLLDLDEEGFKAAEGRGATLADYAELDKLENPDAKNEVLAAIGTANFKYELKRALDKQDAKKRQNAWREKLSTFATEVESKDGYCSVRYLNTHGNPEEYTLPEDVEQTEYFFIIDQWGSIYLLKQQMEVDAAAEDEEKAARLAAAERENARRAQLREAGKRAYALRAEFAKWLPVGTIREWFDEILAYWMMLSADDESCCIDNDVKDLFMLNPEEGPDGVKRVTQEDCMDSVERVGNFRTMWLLVYLHFTDSENMDYCNWWGQYTPNRELDVLYQLLTTLGYEMSDEEKQLQDGTHPLYQKEEA